MIKEKNKTLFHQAKKDQHNIRSRDPHENLAHEPREAKSENNNSIPISKVVAQLFKEKRKRILYILKEKRKSMRRGKKESRRCDCNSRQCQSNQVSSKPDILLPGNESDRRNWVLRHGDAKEVAKEIGEPGKDYSIIHKGEEGEILHELIVKLKGKEAKS